MDASLHDYTENNTPRLRLRKPIRHPNNQLKVIGHTGIDKARQLNVAAFPRTKEEHWFRGNSTSGLTGYGISEAVLDRLTRPVIETPSIVFIIETDNDRVIEYDRAAFEDATVVAYSPTLNESVIGDDAMRVDEEKYPDRQRVLPVDAARQVFTRDSVRILE